MHKREREARPATTFLLLLQLLLLHYTHFFLYGGGSGGDPIHWDGFVGPGWQWHWWQPTELTLLLECGGGGAAAVFSCVLWTRPEFSHARN